MADQPQRYQQRCQNGRCPSAKHGGRILFEHDGQGTYYKRDGKSELVIAGAAISINCPACGEHWINPSLAAAGQRAIDEAAERVREQLVEKESTDAEP